jgi:hypothetical protein
MGYTRYAVQGRRKQCEVAGAAISKGHFIFLSGNVKTVKTLLNGYFITCGYYGSENFDINFEQFYSLHRAKGAK